MALGAEWNFLNPETHKARSGRPHSYKTIVSEMSKIKARSQKSSNKASDIARYLHSDVVEFDGKKKD
jgi:hypothetical protein